MTSQEIWTCSKVCLENSKGYGINDFSSSWNTLTIHLSVLASQNDHLPKFMTNSVHEKKRLPYSTKLWWEKTLADLADN